jgi:TonB family protein
MKRPRDGREESHFLADSPQFNAGGLFKAGIFSLLLHMGLIVVLGLSARPMITRMIPSVYRVTIRPFSPPGNGLPQGGSGPGGLSAPVTAEKTKPEEAKKVGEIVEKEKPQKQGRKVEKEVLQTSKKARDEISAGLKKPQKKEERIEREKISGKSLQEAIEEIHKKVALDEIQKRVAQRKGSAEGQQAVGGSQGPTDSSSRLSLSVSGAGTGTGSGAGAGTGSGVGTGKGAGTGTGTGGGSGSRILDDYYTTIWAKIKKGWTLPENLSKGKTDLEAIIVVVIEREGKIQKTWFEKRSGNALYDQMAMRAIKKAEPYPPIPKEFSDSTFEVGIRFYPE